MKRKVRKRLGDLLLEAGMVSPEQLEICNEIQKTSKKFLGAILVDSGFISEEDLIQVLEFQLGIPQANLEKFEINPEVAMKVPESIARMYGLLPISIVNGIMNVAMSDPLDILALDDVKMFSGMEIQPVIATRVSIMKAIEKAYSAHKTMKALEEFRSENKLSTDGLEDADADGNDNLNTAPTVKMVNSILEQAIRSRASDIHFEPGEIQIRIRFRIDGIMQEIMKPDMEIFSAILARIKILGGMDIAEKRIPQDGRITVVVDNKEYDLRISILPVIHGEKIVIRIVDKYAAVVSQDKLGFSKDDLEKFNKMIQAPHGMILVCGPTGSGKSTTLYSAVNAIANSEINIVTIEDPVEGKIAGINQVQVNNKAGMTFASGLRSILRQDPDVIMIGEIRDNETAEIAVKAAITGHLVFSTLHTNTAVGSIVRLHDMGVEPYILASSIVGVIAQRLIRKICHNCKTTYLASEEELLALEMKPDQPLRLSRGRGCPMCNRSGYLGRIGVYEMILMTSAHRKLLAEGCDEEALTRVSMSQGMIRIKDNARRLVLEGVSTVGEFKRITSQIE